MQKSYPFTYSTKTRTTLISLGGDIPYHRICDLRLRHWAQLVRDLSGE
jgi:uncharacterized protein (UPF0248 family)